MYSGHSNLNGLQIDLNQEYSSDAVEHFSEDFDRTTFPVIEVNDSRMGYLIPARYGTGLGPDGRVVGTPPPSSP